MIAVGPQASGLSVGDFAFATHPHQDYFNIPVGDLVSRLPEGADLERAQFAAMFSVALTVLLQRPVRPGEGRGGIRGWLDRAFAAFLARLSAGPAHRHRSLGDSARECRVDWRRLLRGPGRCKGRDRRGEPGPRRGLVHRNQRCAGRAADGDRQYGGARTIAVAAWYGTAAVQLVLSPEFIFAAKNRQRARVQPRRGQSLPPSRKFDTSLQYLQRIDVGRLISHRIRFEDAPSAYQLLDESPGKSLGIILDYPP